MAVGVATTASSGIAGAITTTQTNVGADVNCNVNGLHQGAGPVSTCNDVSIMSEVLVNGSDVVAGANLFEGDVITVRVTVVTEGGQNSFYEETVDGLRNNETGGQSDIQARIEIGLPGQTGTNLSSPSNIKMSRTDTGDRGNAPAINCLAQSGEEAAVSDATTSVTLGGAVVGGTKMSAALSGSTFKAKWDDMAWDRCRGVVSNNGIYPGHVVEFTQTVLHHTQSTQNLAWSLGQLTLARDDGSHTIHFGANSSAALNVVGDADLDGVLDNTDPAPSDPCNPSVLAGSCDQDGDGEVNSVDPDPTDPCQISTGISSVVGCDPDGDGVPSGTVPGSDGIPGVNGGQVDGNNDSPCFPLSTATACTATGFSFTKLTPKRIMDTRYGTGTPKVQVGAGGVLNFQVAGLNGVPANATAVVLNITGTRGTSGTYVTVWPTGVTRPTASVLNLPKGRSRPNLVLATVGAGGQISMYNYQGSIDLVLDVFGYFGPSGDGYTPIVPKRFLDTRYGVGGPATPFAAGATRTLKIGGVSGVPAAATAAVVNVTSTHGTGNSFLTVWPTGVTKPTVSTANWIANETSPNLAIVPLGTNGQISLYNYQGSADVIVDVVGYTSAGAGSKYRPITPSRLFDSRTNTGTPGPWAPGAARVKTVTGGVVPAAATAVASNLTGPKPKANTFFTVYPTGATRPTASNLNLAPGDTRANAVIGGLGTGGGLTFYNYIGTNDMVYDVTGWFGA